MGINDFIRRLKPGERLAIFFLLALITGLIVYNFSTHLRSAFIAVAIISGLLLLTRNLWLPKEYRKLASAIQRLGFIGSVIASAFANYKTLYPSLGWLDKPGVWIVDRFLPAAYPLEEKERLVKVCMAVLLLLIVFVVNYIIKRATWGSRKFPVLPGLESDHMESQKAVVDILAADIATIQRVRGWESLEFRPLEAEVEINIRERRKKSMDDLLTAITKNKRSAFFLILGEPGSGKSMALVKLAADMLAAADTTGVIPLYVNLNEWDFPAPGNPQFEKGDKGLSVYAEEHFVNKLPYPGEVSRNLFLALNARRKFFYIFDSFDEIPMLLNATEAGAPTDRISEAISNFASMHKGNRIILSSRLFRMPVGNPTKDVVLEIRPFAELRSGQVLDDSGLFREVNLGQLMKKTPALASWLANPFTLNLLIFYVRGHPEKFTMPPSLSEMYKFYFEKTLSQKSERMRELGLTIDSIITYCRKIALLLYTDTRTGMYIETHRFFVEFPGIEMDPMLEILTDLKIAQLSGPDSSRFSFNHRRLVEYLVSIGAHENPFLLDPESIPENTRDRDILVLYCEISGKEDAGDIAKFCWQYISPYAETILDPLVPGHYKAIRCLLFLRDAFLYRKECLTPYKEGLSKFLLLQTSSKNPLTQKYAAEAAALLDQEDQEDIIIQSLKAKNNIIQGAAFKTGKTSLIVGPRLQAALERYLVGIDTLTMLSRGGEIKFALQLFPTLEKARKFYRLVEWDNYLYAVGCLFLACNLQTVVMFILAIWPVIALTRYGQRLKKVKSHTLFWHMTDSSNKFIIKHFNQHVKKTWKISVDFTNVHYSPGGVAKLQTRVIVNYMVFAALAYMYFPRLGLILEIIGLVLTFPLFLALLLRKCAETPWAIIKYFGIAMLYFVPFLLALYYLVSLLTTESQQDIIGYTFFALLGLWFVLPSSFLMLRDFFVFTKVKRIRRLDRPRAAKDLGAIHFTFYQMKYIRQVFQNRKVEVVGIWPDNEFPIDASTPAGQLLMKLEEEKLSPGSRS